MKRLIIRLLVVAVMVFAATSAFADYSYTFDANTSSVVGQTGYIELQYNPGISSTGASSAVVSNFTSDATLVGSAALTGDASGQLPSTVTIKNTTQLNDYFQQLTFGSNLQFSLNLSGASGNSFGLSFWGSDGATPLLTTDTANGFATIIDFNANGAVVNNNSNQVSIIPTPIPAAALLFGSGLLGLAGIRKRMNA